MIDQSSFVVAPLKLERWKTGEIVVNSEDYEVLTEIE